LPWLLPPPPQLLKSFRFPPLCDGPFQSIESSFFFRRGHSPFPRYFRFFSFNCLFSYNLKYVSSCPRHLPFTLLSVCTPSPRLFSQFRTPNSNEPISNFPPKPTLLTALPSPLYFQWQSFGFPAIVRAACPVRKTVALFSENFCL